MASRTCPDVLLQALDGDFSEENRNRCRVATSPLLGAVDNLSTFASNPEFASIPAQISNEVSMFAFSEILLHWDEIGSQF